MEDKSHARTAASARPIYRRCCDQAAAGESRTRRLPHARRAAATWGSTSARAPAGGSSPRNRKLYGLAKPARAPHTKTKPMPFAAERRHQYWSVDIRHLDMANIGMKVYCVSILENYSRAILASGVFPTQDLAAYLMILYAAIRQHGVPETLVSDSGAVFVTAKQAKAIYAALGIEKREIERGKPWQNYIETTFKIQRRMADWHFAKATTWAELLAVHDQWVVDYNYQVHWAHQERDDDRRTPRDVLAWYTGRQVTPEELHRLFYRTRFGRKLDRLGLSCASGIGGSTGNAGWHGSGRRSGCTARH